MVSVAEYPLSALAVEHGVLAAKGQGMIAATRSNVFLTQLNPGDVGVALRKAGVVDRTFGELFIAQQTAVYDRRTGKQAGAIPNPRNYWGRVSQPALYADDEVLIQTIPGCCGSGIFMYSSRDYSFQRQIPLLFTNAAMPMPRTSLLVSGSEAGRVEVSDLSRNPSLLIASADLPQLTGHTGAEDIEIRSVWVDEHDRFIFAASSWGNDASRGPDLPSFFVLELRSGK